MASALQRSQTTKSFVLWMPTDPHLPFGSDAQSRLDIGSRVQYFQCTAPRAAFPHKTDDVGCQGVLKVLPGHSSPHELYRLLLPLAVSLPKLWLTEISESPPKIRVGAPCVSLAVVHGKITASAPGLPFTHCSHTWGEHHLQEVFKRMNTSWR